MFDKFNQRQSRAVATILRTLVKNFSGPLMYFNCTALKHAMNLVHKPFYKMKKTFFLLHLTSFSINNCFWEIYLYFLPSNSRWIVLPIIHSIMHEPLWSAIVIYNIHKVKEYCKVLYKVDTIIRCLKRSSKSQLCVSLYGVGASCSWMPSCIAHFAHAWLRACFIKYHIFFCLYFIKVNAVIFTN